MEIKKDSIKTLYPKGIRGFSRDFNYQYNDDVIVLTDMGSDIGTWIKLFDSLGIEYHYSIEEPHMGIKLN